MPFEVFENRGAHRGTATVRFMPKGRIVFNAAASRVLGDTTHVRLLHDPTDNRIGFEPTDEADPLGFKLTRAPSQLILSAASFVQHYNIPLETLTLEREGDIFTAALPTKPSTIHE